MHNTDGQKACIYLSTHSFEPEIVPVQGEDIMDTVRKMIGCEWVEVVPPTQNNGCARSARPTPKSL